MQHRLVGGVCTAALLSLFASACGGIVDPSKNVTDTFTGTIPVQGTTRPGHPFSSSKTGEYTVKVTALSPSSNSLFGTVLAQGTTDGQCVGNLPILQQNSFSALNAPALGGSIIAGRYCLFLFDIGVFQTAQTYTVTVSHP
jgi:hypothetical protein